MKIKYHNPITEEDVEVDVEDGSVTLADDRGEWLAVETLHGSEGFRVEGSDSLSVHLKDRTDCLILKVD